MRWYAWITATAGLVGCVCFSVHGALADRMVGNPPNLLTNLIAQSNAHLGSEDEYLNRVSGELLQAKTKLHQIQISAKQLQSKITMEQQRVIPILQFQYEHGPSAMLWLSLLFSASDGQSFQSAYVNLMEILHNRNLVLQQYDHDIGRYAALQNDALSTLEDLQIAEANIAAEKQMYGLARRQSGEQVGNAQLMDRLSALVQDTWDHTLAPQVQNTLAQLDVSVQNLPAALPKSDTQLSLTHADVDIPQTVLNRVIQQNPALRNVQFLFRHDHLILSAQSGKDMILTIGHLVVEANQRRADYVIDQVAVDGILVSAQTAQKWMHTYGFYIDVTRLSDHLRIHSLAIDNQLLRLSLDVSI